MMKSSYAKLASSLLGLLGSIVVLSSCAGVSDLTQASSSAANALKFTTTSFPSAAQGQLYTVVASATGGASPYSFTLTGGSLPPGLTLAQLTGTISGRLNVGTAGNTYNFTVTATDSATNTVSQAYSIAVASVPAVATTTLTAAVVGVAYSQTVSGSGGVSPLAITLSSGTLPTGLSLNGTSGVISGTPSVGTTAGSPYSLTFTVTDALGQTANQVIPLAVSTQPRFSSLTLPTAAAGTTYRSTVGIYGGKPPYTFTFPGTFPAWMAIGSSTGTITGTPLIASAGLQTFSITATDSNGTAITGTFQMQVNAAGLSYSLGGGKASIICSVANCQNRVAALADFNNDGKLDIAVTGWTDTHLHISMGDGAGNFIYNNNYTNGGTTNPWQLATADFDGDGYQDVVYSNYTSNNLTVWHNVGGGSAGSFAAPLNIATCTTPWGVLAKDVNGDGKADLIVACYGSNQVEVFLNTSVSGTISFGAGALYASSGSEPKFVAAGDLNGDGCPDLVVANYNNGSHLGVLLGNKVGTCQGTFAAAVPYNVAGQNSPVGIGIADFYNTGILAVAVAFSNTSSMTIIPGVGNGTLNVGSASSYSAINQTANNNIIVDQIDSGTSWDVAVAQSGAALKFTVFFNNGSGSFTNGQTSYTMPRNDGNIVSGKVYGSSRPDIVMMAYDGAQLNNLAVTLQNDGTGNFEAPLMTNTGIGNTALSVNDIVSADFDGDGLTDMAAINYTNGTISCLRGNGSGVYTPPTTIYSMGGGGSPGYYYVHPVSVVADFDNDGKTDLAVTNFTASSVGVMLNNSTSGTCSFGATAAYLTSGANPMGIAAADLNKDGFIDLVTTTWTGDTVEVFFNNGNGTFANTVSYTTGASTGNGVAIGDVNGDGYPDIVVSNWSSNSISVLTQRTTGNTFNAPVTYAVGGSEPSGLILVDTRRTGLLDAVVANWNSGTISVMLNGGSGNYTSVTTYTVGTNPNQVVATDVDQDGIVDLLVNVQGGDYIYYLKGNGDGTFNLTQKYFTNGSNTSTLTAGFINGDVKPDIMFGNWGGLIGGFLNYSH